MNTLHRLGIVEQRLLELFWKKGTLTAEQCRTRWSGTPLKESTMRTMLRRLEEKGYLSHRVEGRTYFYTVRQKREGVAARAVKQVTDRLLGGSVEALLVGLVRNEVVGRKELMRIAKRISQERKA